MVYVEWLRAKRRLTVFMLVAIGFTALLVLPALFGHTYVNTHGGTSVGIMSSGSGTPVGSGSQGLQQLTAHVKIPFSALLGVAALLTYIFSTQLGSSLNAQHASLNLTFTKPASRVRMALSFFAVDLAAIVLCYGLCLIVVCILPFVVLGLLGRVYADPLIVPAVFISIGAPFMYYGILQTATAWSRGGTGPIIGLSWPLFVLCAIPGTPPFGAIINALVELVRNLDPLIYLGAVMMHVSPNLAAPLPSLSGTIAVAWLIGLVGCALATLEWRRLEV
jgi:hypothetical protein